MSREKPARTVVETWGDRARRCSHPWGLAEAPRARSLESAAGTNEAAGKKRWVQGTVPAASFKHRLTKWSSAASEASPLQRRVRPRDLKRRPTALSRRLLRRCWSRSRRRELRPVARPPLPASRRGVRPEADGPARERDDREEKREVRCDARDRLLTRREPPKERRCSPPHALGEHTKWELCRRAGTRSRPQGDAKQCGADPWACVSLDGSRAATRARCGLHRGAIHPSVSGGVAPAA